MQEHPWKTLDSEVIYESPWVTVTEDQVTRPDGSPGQYAVVDVKDGVLLIAEDAEENVYLMEAYRYPTQRWAWELPTGGTEPGDTPEITAQKELQEELGLTSTSWVKLGEFSPSFAGTMRDRQHIFVARNCIEGAHNREPGEAIRAVKKVTRDALFELARTGTIEDGQTLSGLLHYKLWIEANEATS
jgi:8-oxo-dGTP pyrophosphatase MutT (NUDIX family)